VPPFAKVTKNLDNLSGLVDREVVHGEERAMNLKIGKKS